MSFCDRAWVTFQQLPPDESQPSEPKDERYKNIDDKMIELITNEIMDQVCSLISFSKIFIFHIIDFKIILAQICPSISQ